MDQRTNAVVEVGRCSSSRWARAVAILTQQPVAEGPGRAGLCLRRAVPCCRRHERNPPGFPAAVSPGRGCASTSLTSTRTTARTAALASSTNRGHARHLVIEKTLTHLGWRLSPPGGRLRGGQVSYAPALETHGLLRTSARVTRLARRDIHAVDGAVPSVNDRPSGNVGRRPPLHLGDRRPEQLGVNGCSAEVHAICRQRPVVMLLPANPHECWRIASKSTVRTIFDITVKRRRRFGVEFCPSFIPSTISACKRSLPIVSESSLSAQNGKLIVDQRLSMA